MSDSSEKRYSGVRTFITFSLFNPCKASSFRPFMVILSLADLWKKQRFVDVLKTFYKFEYLYESIFNPTLRKNLKLLQIGIRKYVQSLLYLNYFLLILSFSVYKTSPYDCIRNVMFTIQLYMSYMITYLSTLTSIPCIKQVIASAFAITSLATCWLFVSLFAVSEALCQTSLGVLKCRKIDNYYDFFKRVYVVSS